MPTLAELQINVDTTQAEKGIKRFNDLATASDKVTKSLKDQKAAQDALNQGGGGGNGGGNGGGGNPRPINDLSSAIDRQTKKLKELEAQRKALNSSDLKTTNPAEFARLNREIDTNIELVRRQGGAMDRLAAQVERERKAREAAALASQKQQEALERVIASREALAAKAAIREQRELDSTLGRLSAQIKAQQEYNRTVEQLNKSRSGVGPNGPTQPTISATEYDTYVKLAAARRDAALAAADNSKEVASASSKIDSLTATLGKAERAEIQYARGLRDLNEGLRLNILTADQYNTKLQQITDKRDRAIAAANSNAAAEKQFATQLQSVLTTYDPVLRAQVAYNDSIRVLAQGLQQGKITAEQFNKALTDQRVALDGVKSAQAGSQEYQAKQYQSALDRLLPYNSQLRNLADAERILQQQQSAGKVVTDQQIAAHKQATEAIAAERKEIERRMDASRRNTNSAKQDAAALRGVPAQITDIAVSLQGGQAPLTVLLQQGGQLKDMFGGIVPAAKALGGAVVSMMTPLTIVAGSMAALAIATKAGADELIAFKQAAIASNNFAGVSANDFSQMRDGLDSLVGTSRKASEALTLMESSGKITGSVFLQVGEAAIKLERATGTLLKDIIADFASLGKDPVRSAVALDEKYRFLTSAVLAQADALVRQGKEQEATTLLQGKMADAAADAAQRMVDNLNLVGKTLKAIKDGVSETIDEFFNLGRVASSADRLKNLLTEQKQIEASARGTKGLFSTELNDPSPASTFILNNNPRYQQNQKEIEQLQQKIKLEDTQSAAERRAEEDRKRANVITNQNLNAYEANVAVIDKVKAAEVALERVRAQGRELQEISIRRGSALTADELRNQKASEDAASKKLADAIEAQNKKKNPTGPADTRQVQEVKSNLAVITSEYDGYYKKITALREASVISNEAAYYAQKAILDAQAKATDESYARQIDAIQALQGNKKNSVSTNISLDNQLTKAEAARIKAQQDIQSKQEQNTAKFQGDMKKREAAILSYKNALDQQVETLRKQGEREVAGLGQGTRRRALNDTLNGIDDKFNAESLNLSEQQSKGMDPTEYAAKLEALKKIYAELKDVAVKNYEDMGEAQKDFTLGASAAWEDYFDNASNFAGKMQDAFSGVFSDLTDSLYDFVTTGKLSFSDLASNFGKAVLRMGVEWAAAQTLRMLGITAEKTLVIGAEAAKASAKVAGNTLAATSSVASNTKIVASEVTSAGTTFSSWLPAALVKSVGTGGAAAIIGGAALVAAFALSKGLKKGFSNGGYTGDGGVNDPAGIVHKGEVVWSQKDIQRAGGVAAVESLRKGGTSPSISGSGGMSKGGDVNIPINVQVQGQPGMSDAESLKQAKVTADTVRGMMLQVIQQQKRPGGLLA